MRKSERLAVRMTIWGACLFGGFLCVVVGLAFASLTRELHHEQTQRQQATAALADANIRIGTYEDRLATDRRQIDAFQNRTDQLEKAAKATAASRDGGITAPGASPWMDFKATWYSSAGGVGDGLITATGTHVRDNWTVAVDPHVIPLGSLIEVRFPDGHTQLYQALDTGGAIVGHHIDIFDHSESQCTNNGVEAVQVRILVKGSPTSQ